MQIPIAQLCHTTLTITQTLQPAVHQTYRTFSWIKGVLMQKEKTHCHQMTKTLKHKYKPNKIKKMIQTQTDNRTENRTNASIQGKETTRGNNSTQ